MTSAEEKKIETSDTQPEEKPAAPPDKKKEAVEIEPPTNFEIDSLHILPLVITPLNTPGLKRARLVKNNRIETMVEMFKDVTTGSGHITLSELGGFFSNSGDKEFRQDTAKVEKLTQIPSFDVYSVRIALRSINIDVEKPEFLSLSAEKRAELSDRMQAFTKPLLNQVYGADAGGEGDMSDLSAMLRNPDKGEALKNLNILADKLKVNLLEIPKFVEDYGDIFLSLAYFQNILDEVVPRVEEFLEWVEELRGSYQIKHDRAKDKILKAIVGDISDVAGSITGRFEVFDRKTNDFWSNVSAEKFQEVRQFISDHHMTVGGVLCGLTLKMDHWKERFPTTGSGGPQQRIEFVFSEILPGLDHIKKLENQGANR